MINKLLHIFTYLLKGLLLSFFSECVDSPNELVLHGHTAPVVACDWMCDGRQLVTGSWDHTALLWDCDTGQTIHTLKGKSMYYI